MQLSPPHRCVQRCDLIAVVVARVQQLADEVIDHTDGMAI